MRAKRSECELERAIKSVGKRTQAKRKNVRRNGACASERGAIASEGDDVQVRGNEFEHERARKSEKERVRA